ncbi:hypothetical protein ZWY2020_005955 [Hordeum vulgare]|nr:hypothetical protein ZWY2020_005955 [Hordeum vulgare]
MASPLSACSCAPACPTTPHASERCSTAGCACPGSEPHARWSKKLLKVDLPRRAARKSSTMDPRKVIPLGGGLFRWVNLREGILVWDVLDPGVTVLLFCPDAQDAPQ